MQALATGQAWLTDETKLRRLIELSVGQQQREHAEQFLRAWESRPWPIFLVGLDEGLQIAQYHSKSLQAAKNKLRQFPKGSKFRWTAPGGHSDDRIFQELSSFAAGHGIEVARTPP
jgi:hypothetical protein